MTRERIQMISDGIIAIIITIMMLDIKVPGAGDFNRGSFAPILQQVLIYALSFLVIAIMWLNHHHIFVGVEKVNIRITWLNFLLLFAMSLIPLPTKVLGENFHSKDAHLFYGIVITMSAICYSILQQEVNKHTTILNATEISKINRLNWTSTATYSLSIPLSQINIYLSTFIFVLLPIIYFVPSKILTNKSKQ